MRQIIKNKCSFLVDLFSDLRFFYYRNFFSSKEKLIRKRFKKKFAREPNLENPVNFNDKLQWLKLYWYDPLATKCADKYEVRNFVQDRIGTQYLNDLYEVYDSVEEIKFQDLPKSFVLKSTHGTGDNLICEDKYRLNWKKAKRIMRKWLKRNIYDVTGEWVYKDIKPRIISERFLSEGEGSLTDYKFYCFHGEPKYCQIIKDRNSEGVGTIDFFDKEWNHMEFTGLQDAPKSTEKIQRPVRYEEMLELASKLSKPFPFVRVDFYNVNGNIYFGELTFFPMSGFGSFYPFEWNEKVGDLLTLPNKSYKSGSLES